MPSGVAKMRSLPGMMAVMSPLMGLWWAGGGGRCRWEKFERVLRLYAAHLTSILQLVGRRKE